MSEFDTQPTITTLLEEMRKGFAAVLERLDLIEAKIDTLNDRLLTLEGRVRLHDKRIGQLENRV